MPNDLDARIEKWRAQLLDLTKRNRLINFKAGRTGGVALAHPGPGVLWNRLLRTDSVLTFAWRRDLIDLPPEPVGRLGEESLTLFDPSEAPETVGDSGVLERCLRSARLRPNHVLAELPDRQLATRLTRLALNARESLAEHGVATLFVAFGFLRWFDSRDSKVEIRSPLLLVPVRLERESVDAPWKLLAEDADILPNHSLAQLLANDFRLRLPIPDEDAADLDESNWRTRYFTEIEKTVAQHTGWGVLDEAALGTFNFQKLAMWEDLGRNREHVQNHDLCRALAGDPTVALTFPSDLPRAEDLDKKVHPQETFHILDADSSQHEAVAAATRGASLVLDGPPGTGKSQTIANVIAELMAAGKTVLFVSEKAAALEVVQRRLQIKGLGDFVLACHSHKANKREVVGELGRCLTLGPEDHPDTTDNLQRLYEARGQLNEYVRELHSRRMPLGKTIYQVHGELSRLTCSGYLSRCPIPQVLDRDATYLRHVAEMLARLPDCRSVIEEHNRHPWHGCQVKVFSLTMRDDVCHHFERLSTGVGVFRDVNAVFHSAGLATGDPTWVQCQASVEEVRAVLACPPVPANWFTTDARTVAEALVRLDALTAMYRRGVAALPEFVTGSVRNAPPASLVGALDDEPNVRIVPRAGETLRGLCLRAAAIVTALRNLSEQTVAVEEAAQRIAELLKVPACHPVQRLRRLAVLADHLARTKTIRKSWWDAARRKELLKVVTRCREESQAAQESRADLTDRLAPAAFETESAVVAADAAWYDNFLKRLLPSWWSLNAQVAGWYIGEAPDSSNLLRDLKALAAYHKRKAYCRQVRQQYAADVLVSDESEPDWSTTLNALQSVDHLEQFGKIPLSVQLALSEDGKLDRRSLSTAARALDQKLASLRQQMEAAAQDYDFGEVAEGTPSKIRLPVRDLATWLESQVLAVTRRTALWQQIAGLLAEGQDLHIESVRARIKTIGDLAKIKVQIGVVCSRIWSSKPPNGVEDQDWSVLRARAEALIALMNQWKVPLPPAVVKALISPEIRTLLAEAIGRHDAVRRAAFADSWRFLQELFDTSTTVSTGITIQSATLTALQRWLADRAGDAQRIQEWAQFCEIEREVTKAGVVAILQEVQSRQLSPEQAAEAFRTRFLRLWLDAVYEQVSALRRFGSENHERLIERFRDLDQRSVAATSSRIRERQLGHEDRPRLGTGDAPGSSELGTLLREVNKKSRHLPLRKLFLKIPTLLPRLKPCLMMSPLAVSTYLDSPDLRFDLVIFDEASQVRPQDAICAVYRGRQLIVAGDQKQLPPTSFFERVQEDDDNSTDEADGGLEDFESILDVCCTLGLPRQRLRWHYRSRREGLIAFANHHVYGNELVTFPSIHDVDGNPAIAFEFVADGRWKAGARGGFNAVEARRTAELVLEHFRNHPDQSLGVIAFSQRQQMRILGELEQLRQANPGLEQFFHEDTDEPFFVKNIESVQGDERDVIFLGIGYGPDDSGRVAMRFGPLNRQGGERRLNVAITRARQGMIVVSSMRAHHIDLSRTAAIGAKLLRAYLDYAERGVETLRGTITEVNARGFDSPFEQEVYDELIRRGLTLHPQVGCSSFCIDLAVVDPAEPGRYLLGIECDGATYHSSATARDRDRLRQEILEDLGWRICRIWSTDWLRDRDGQVQRVLDALEKARREGPTHRRPTKPPEHQPVKVDTVVPQGKAQAVPNYADISEVPDADLRDAVCQTLREFGATEAGELTQAVSRRLGFKRTGRIIQATVEACVNGLIQAGLIVRIADQRLQLSQPARASSG